MSRHRPTFVEFAVEWRHCCVPVFRQLTGDSLTPVSAFGRSRKPAPSFLFESVIGGEKVGRFSFLGHRPFLRFEAAAMRSYPRRDDPAATETVRLADPLVDLQQLVEKYRAPHLPGLPASRAGRRLRRLRRRPLRRAAAERRRRTTASCPTCRSRFSTAWSSSTTSTRPSPVVAHAHVDPATPAKAYRRRLQPRRSSWSSGSAQARADLQLTDIAPDGPVTRLQRSNFSREAYEDAVRKCKEYIKAGDIFQVVLSQRFEPRRRPGRSTSTAPCAWSIPARSCSTSRSGEFSLVGARRRSWCGSRTARCTIRPLAGTRRRGHDEDEDERLAAELLADPKERAEHIMLVDLGRNDVGRVADSAPSQLSDVMTVERYSHVMHISTNVTGRLQPGKTAFDALRAGPARRHGQRRRQGAGHADHRRARAAPPRALRRRRRLRRFHRQHGYVHRPAHDGLQGPDRLRSGRRRHRRRQRARHRVRGDGEQGAGLLKAIEIAENQLSGTDAILQDRVSRSMAMGPEHVRLLRCQAQTSQPGRRRPAPGPFVDGSWSIRG